MAKTLAQKLQIKANYQLQFINSPENFTLGELPDGVKLNVDGNEQDVVILLVKLPMLKS